MKLLLFVLLNLFSFAVYAHSGHGGANVFVHALDHALWILGGLALFAVVFFLTRRQ